MTVRVERAGNRILVGSERPLAGLKESIPGAYFRKDKIWSVPLDLTTCAMLRERYGNRLEIGPELTAWARAEKAHRAAMEETASAIDATLNRLPEVAPILSAAMGSRTYQRAAARFVADTEGRDGRRRALIGDTVGLGKSVEAMASVLEAGVPGPYLIVCPKTAVEIAWTPEFRRWLPEDTVITIPEGKEKREGILDGLLSLWQMNQEDYAAGREPMLSLDRTWVIVHPAAVRTQTLWICPECGSETKFRAGVVSELDCGHPAARKRTFHNHTFPQLFGISWGAVIADESDQMLIRKTGTPNLQRRGMEMLRDLVPKGGCRIAMSGTPFRSKPHQIWSTLNWLDPVRFGSKWNFLGKYWQLGGYSGYEIKEFRPEREQLLLGELKDIMIRRTREEVRGDLPAKIYQDNRMLPADEGLPAGVYLHMTLKQQRAYKAMEQTASAEVEGGEVSAIGVLAELTRLKQFASATGSIGSDGEFIPTADGNKYLWLVDFLKELGLPDRPATKVVFASQFTKLLNAFAAGIAKDVGLNAQRRMGLITGDVSQKGRTEVVERFEDPDDPLDILFINTKAGGSAITLDAADIMIIDDETWVDDEQQQLEGRIDNRKPERKVCPRTYIYLRSYGTVEEGIALANVEAKRQGKALLDDGRSKVEFARSVLAKRRQTAFKGGPQGKIRRCRKCGVSRNQWHAEDCHWEGD